MGLMDGKNVVIFGVANKRSIAWGIAQALQREGANLALGFQN
ncbi:MAG: SDR family oxidoreductase, partial [Planctomycetota bacterium]|nr:SDR family oxidoreductase [Planctomycetota bacterium]